MKDFSSLKQALKLADMGLQTSPLSPDSKIPLIPTSQGGHGYKNSTCDKAKLNNMFSNAPKANLCLRLDTSHLIMVDVDLHTKEANGKETLLKLAKHNMVLPSNGYVESTPHNGLHYYFKVDMPVHDIPQAFGKNSGIEIHTLSSSIYPSEIDGKQYEPLDGHTLEDVKPLPKWLLDYINKQAQTKKPFITARYRDKLYTGKLLDEFVNGASSGNRNAFLTRIAGKMFAVGAEADTVYNMLLVINDNFLTPPLKEREINIIFESILRRDSQPQFNF